MTIIEDTRAEQAASLLKEGQQAFAQGRDKDAHTLWRRAAALDPRNEAVWQGLLTVVKTDADRRQCLENILAINPDNIQARRQLKTYTILQGLTQSPDIKEVVPLPPLQDPLAKRLYRAFGDVMWRLVLFVLLVVTLLVVVFFGMNLVGLG